MLVKYLYTLEDFDLLKSEIFTLINEVGFQNNQIMCQTLDESKEDFITGIGRIDELEHQNEESYKFIQNRLKGSYIEKIILKHNAFRTRILKLSPRSCYSIHADPTPRIHIPIVVNKQCWMIWPFHEKCHSFIDGKVYWTDTTKSHTYLNGDGNLERIHLVMCVSNDI
jgi:hypothetical protein